MWRDSTGLVCAMLVAIGCAAPPRPPADLLRAEALVDAGKDSEALGAYTLAGASCKAVHDTARRREWCGAALFGRAQTMERLGQTAEATLAYAAVPGEPDVPTEVSARSLTAAGRLELAAGKLERAYGHLWRVVTAYPDSAAADEALRRLVADGRRRNPGQLDVLLGQLNERLAATAIGDNLLLSRAELTRAELARPAEAERLYDELARRYPDSTLHDDAVWEAARLAEEGQDFAGAAARYRALLASRRSSFLVGSYNSVWLDDAQLAVGRLERDRLGDPRGALRSFALLERNYPDSILVDDALYELAVTYDLLGDKARACDALLALARRFPDSKFRLELAPALAARLGCTS